MRRGAGRPFDAGLARRLKRARLALVWERLWPALWPATSIAGVFLVLSWADVWSLFPGWVHLALLVVLGGAFLGALWRGIRGTVLPTMGEATRRLEMESGLHHRPLTTIADELATGRTDEKSAALWELHRRRALAQLRNLRVGWPRAGLAARDPYALRAALALLLVITFAGAGGEVGDRLAAAFHPQLSLSNTDAAKLEAWLTPPAYTGAAPIMLGVAERGEDTVQIPAATTFLARVSGGRGVPALSLDGRTMPFTAIDSAAHQIEHVIETGRRLAVIQGQIQLGVWELDIITDQAPHIMLAEEPTTTVRRALKISYEARDDYGLSTVKAVFRRPGDDTRLELGLPLAGLRLTTARGTGYHDLTPHPWAGLPVILTLAATDASGQIGESAPYEMVLPERVFFHPIARAIIEQRKALSLKPESWQRVATALGAMTLLQEEYNHDVTAHLALRSAKARLNEDHQPETIAEVQDLLWDTALRIEDGNVSLAEAALREAQTALMDALARDASDEEIERLMNELQEAMSAYLQALAEQARRMAEEGAPPLDVEGALVRENELEEMLDRARQLNQLGAREAARQLLAELQNILENLRAGITAMPQETTGEQLLRDLNALMNRQQQLLDQTFRSEQTGEPPDGMNFGNMADQQQALRNMLGDIMRQLGESDVSIPNPLGRADQAMRDARRSLAGKSPGDAMAAQSEALDQLRQGADDLVRMLLAEDGFGNGQQHGDGPGGLNRDPLGRLMGRGGQIDDRSVRIPDEADVQRARQILDELYRRAGEPWRSTIERDYIDRLLRRF